MYMDIDPNIKNRYKGVVYIAMASTNSPQELRHKDARNTGYDARNDPAYHYTGISQFEVIQTVRTGVGSTAVQSLTDLKVTDDKNEAVTQAWLNEELAILNGKKSLAGLSARNTHQSAPRRQRMISESKIQNQQAARDSALALSAFNKMVMQQIRIVNRLQEANVAVIFVALGSSTFSAYTRKDGVLFNKIPPALLQPNMPTFETMQKFFGLLEAQNSNKTRYIDYLNVDASLNVITLKPRHGKAVAKRPSTILNKWPSPDDYNEDQIERFKCFSESVDINVGGADLIVIKNDMEVPIMNYLVQLEGSPQTASHLAHLGNLIPNWFERPMCDKVRFTRKINISNKILNRLFW